MERTSLGIAIIGCGVVGRRRANIVQSTGLGIIRVVADIDPERAAAAAETFRCVSTTSWSDAIRRDDVRAVIIATTHKWLAPITIEALRQGKHVFVEKPMARSHIEAKAVLDELDAQAGAPRLVLKVGYNHRHHPAIVEARRLMMDGAIGEPFYIRCRYGHGARPGYAEEWRADRELSGGGQLLDQGIHVLDLCRWFIGEFEDAFAFTATYFWTPANARPNVAPVEDNVFGLFRTTEGRVATLHTSWTQWKNLFSYEVFGREGYLIVDGLGRTYGPERLVVGRRRPESGPPDEQYYEFRDEDRSWEAEWLEFVDAVHGGCTNFANGYDGWKALRMADALYRSAQTGALVRIDSGTTKRRFRTGF